MRRGASGRAPRRPGRRKSGMASDILPSSTMRRISGMLIAGRPQGPRAIRRAEDRHTSHRRRCAAIRSRPARPLVIPSTSWLQGSDLERPIEILKGDPPRSCPRWPVINDQRFTANIRDRGRGDQISAPTISSRRPFKVRDSPAAGDRAGRSRAARAAAAEKNQELRAARRPADVRARRQLGKAAQPAAHSRFEARRPPPGAAC